MRLVDSHCHLDFPDFEGELEAVLQRARERGVERFVTISTRVRRFAQLRAIIDRFDDVYASIGTHCLHAHEEPDVTVEEIVEIAALPKVVAIGEAGLDYHYTYETRDEQERGFRRHIEAARRTGLPLVIHAREADDDVAAILEEEMRAGEFKAVLHCFTAGPDLARRGLDLGLTVSFSGIATFKNAEAIRDVARIVPLDRMLVETDAPYLAPQPHRGKRNEPAFVADTATGLAKALGMEPEALAEATTQNFYRLFSKVKAPAHAE
ncbi:TatD family hydrolase [Acuticoccus mangrovi]|uniref:TatD family hydrolase n=1 Tax=Acuticoccus mangrovi TaxID=2796142 RepID=A0A934INL8_9HYPH|nr:TatD family hydrolase [Acuticoccus mangrovi]MBJ3774714.1 TatD family hydrolase [Acuticoccus mangrovi]